MRHSRSLSAVLLRASVLGVSVFVAYRASDLATIQQTVLHSVLIGQVVFFLIGSALAWRRAVSPPVALLLLAGDVLAVGAVGCWLHAGLEPQVAFLAGYTVALLVAVVGGTAVAAVLGTMAGAMTLALATTMFATMTQQAPDLELLAYQILLTLAASYEAARVIGWCREEASRLDFNERLEREMREREAEAAELVTFAQAMATSSGLSELAEAVVNHLRCHFALRARAVVLETRSEGVALWEENGRLTGDHVERRRSFLQEAMARVGNHLVIPRLQARSIGNRPLPEALDFRTRIEVPIRSAGRIAGVLVLGDPRRNAVEERRIGILADVARRVGEATQRMERQGNEESQRTSLLLRQMREGVLLLGPDGRVLLANPAARKALGCDCADAPLPDAVGEHALADLAETPAGVSRRFRAEVPVGSDASTRTLACTAVGILDGPHRLGTLVTLADVTEEELARHRLVTSEKMTLVGQTLAGVAHELNNPLTALMGYADLLTDHVDESRVGLTLKKIQEQALRATRIVKNLLSVARQRNPERTRIQLGEVAQQVVDLFAYEARLSNVEVAIHAPDGLPAVLGDPHSLQQIFVNLVQNGIHALKAHDGERHINIELRALPDTVTATVSDTGPGVPETLRSRVFQPFFTTKGPNQGTGLGLALARTVARDHGGDLILEQLEGRGASFVLRLPIAKQKADAGEEPPEPRDLTQPLGLRVLVVDDEKDVREALVAQLGRVGCEVDSTSSAPEAMQMLGKGDYDALLVDIRMPGTSGIDLHHIVQQKSPDQANRMVFMTGDYTNEDIMASVKQTGNHLLEKPFTLEEMLHAIATHGTSSGNNAKDVQQASSSHDATIPGDIVRLR